MSNPFELIPELRAVVEEQNKYNFERARAVQARMDARELAKRNDDRFSLGRLIDAMSRNEVENLAPYEAQLSKHIATRLNKEPEPGFWWIPIDPSYRDLSAGTNTQLVYANVGPGNTFVHYLESFFHLNAWGFAV